MNELKPCPFCGEESDLEIDHFLTYSKLHPDLYEVHCVICGGCGGGGWTTEEAIEAWNTRIGMGHFKRNACRISNIFEDNGTYQYELSCGHSMDWTHADPPFYCPECGRRVVD